MKKQQLKKLLAMVLAVMLAVSSVVSCVMPALARSGLIGIDQLQGGGGGSTVIRDSQGDIISVTASDNAKTIYFGSYWQSYKGRGTQDDKTNYNKEGIKWRVLANDNGTVLLLSDKGLYADAFNNSRSVNTWGESAIRATLNNTTSSGGFAGDAFSVAEYEAIAETEIKENNTTTQDKLFLLSKEEAQKKGYGLEDKNSRVTVQTELAKSVKMYDNKHPTTKWTGVHWQLRSPQGTTFADYIDSAGNVTSGYVDTDNRAVRPAMNLNPEPILFLSAATDGKRSAACGGSFSLPDVDPTAEDFAGWKLTLKDAYDETTNPNGIKAPTNIVRKATSDGFNINTLAELVGEGGVMNIGGGVQKVGTTHYLSYDEDTTGKNMYVSALLYDSSGKKMLNYAKVASVETDTTQSGVFALNLSNVETGQKIKFFAEQENGDYMTDYASELVDGYDVTTPSTSGSVVKILNQNYANKNLTANLFADAELGFDKNAYDTNIIVDANQTGKITADATSGTGLTGSISVGSNATLTMANTFDLSSLDCLKIQSDVENNTSGKIEADTLAFGENPTLKISVYDPIFATVKESITDKKISVLSATNLGALASDNVIGVVIRGARGLFTPIFEVAGNEILLNGFDFEIDRRYKLKDMGAYDGTSAIPYGYIVKLDDESGTQRLYKIVTATDDAKNLKPWGRVGRGLDTKVEPGKQVTKEYVWHTADEDDPVNHLVAPNAEEADITVIYNGSNPAPKRQEEIGDFTAYVELHGNDGEFGGAIYNNKNYDGEVTADFLSNYAKAESSPYQARGGAIYNGDGATIWSITGDFLGNYAKFESESFDPESFDPELAETTGGAIYNEAGATIGGITGDFLGNYASGAKAHGGAIDNEGKITEGIAGDFLGNYALSTINNSNAYGGAIYNKGEITRGITGDFLGNYALDKNGGIVKGGAIYNEGTIGVVDEEGKVTGEIIGDFLGNYALGSNANGGAIANTGTIKKLAGKFLGNYATSTEDSATGGAIYNTNDIFEITGNFVRNYVSTESSYAYGGAIFISVTGKVEKIMSNFTENYVIGGSSGFGGAINNYGTLKNITGTFLTNYASGKSAYGGAIRNNKAKIEDIQGDFIGNHVNSASDEAYGGAIHNQNSATITNITADFRDNYAQSSSGVAKGGAIYNNYKATISNITGNFVDNYALAGGENESCGGAIYNGAYDGVDARIRIITDGKDIIFTGNTADLGGAIYNEQNYGSNTTVVQLCAESGKSITFVGDKNNAKVDSVHNEGSIEINNSDTTENENETTYSGTVNFAHITDAPDRDSTAQSKGTMTIYNGTVNVYGSARQAKIDNKATLNLLSTSEIKEITGNGTVTNKGDLTATFTNASGISNFINDSTWRPIFDDSDASINAVNLTLNSNGIINMNDKDWDGEEREFRTLDINGDFGANGGTFVINTDLGADTPTGDVITLTNTDATDVSGQAKVQVAYDRFFDEAEIGEKIEAEDGHTFLTVTNGTIKITAKETRYNKDGKTIAFTPNVVSNAGNTSWSIKALTASDIKEEVGEITKAVSDTAEVINLAWLETTNTLQKRLGDLRGGEASNTGWARFQRSLDDKNNGRKLNVSGNLYQIGYDFALKNDTKNHSYLGLSLEHFDGTQSYNIGGGDIKSTTFSTYYTKIYDSGHYFDFILRYGRYESDTTSCDTSLTTPELTKLDYAMNGVTLSGEYGYRANIGNKGLYLEPQAELIYGYLGGAKKTSSAGTLADIDSTNHFVSRLGLAFGQRVKNLNYYLRTSYYHDFAGTTNITYGDASYKQDSAQNWWEVSLGGGWNVSNTSYFYAELTKHFKDVSNSLNFNLGFRFTL